ncbi:uncharacterized protein K441DRAFT_32169 [Cenococcum geophilum 1.58]|uniref:uncharacterized protein n=1 Tax=Cenococcum geophilum 1.58 TaxID=794803 RepID=UPI000DC8A6D5|nr:hypothetical protein K441DRAFT_32169 [Cenococcum geophilum 1.58]
MANRRAALEPGLRPPHPNEPVMGKKPKAIISTSAMFKRPHPPTRKAPSTGHALKSATNVAKAPNRSRGIGKASHKPQVSSILKKPGEVRLSEQHPLTVAFKGMALPLPSHPNPPSPLIPPTSTPSSPASPPN